MASTTQTVDTKTNAVQRIAEYASKLRYEDLDEMSITRARQVVLDTLGTTLGGYQTELGQLTADYAAQVERGDEATVVADGRRSSLEGAAWANGTISKHLGMDDSHRKCGHVASELVPIIWALGESRKLSGRDAIVALAAGYDVFGAIQPHVSEWQRERGLDHKSQAGTLASAVTAAVAMGLDSDKIGNALALAMDLASGTEQYVYDAGLCDTKDLLAGYAARNGIYAAKLAEFGFRGPPGALDGDYGYYHAFGPGYDPNFLSHLGKEFMLAGTGFKPHAGCRHVHACVDACQEILKQVKPNLDDIETVEVGTYHAACTPSFRVNYAPHTVGQAGFSLPVTVSVVLYFGSWYRDDIAAYDQPEHRRLWPKVKVYEDERFANSKGCVVRVTMNDGSTYEGYVQDAKGEPENMLTDDEFKSKFRDLAGDLLPTERVEELISTCYRFEDLADVGELVRLSTK